MTEQTTTMTAVCKQCEARYRVPASYEGRTFPCKKCGSPVLVKSRSATGRRPTVRRYTRSRAAVPKKATPLQIASGVISLIIVVAIVVYFFLRV